MAEEASLEETTWTGLDIDAVKARLTWYKARTAESLQRATILLQN